MLEITLNGNPISLDADPAMPLLYAIRDIAQLTGTKFGCGLGLCGACTVHVNGEPVRSCVTPLSTTLGKSITTIEGLSAQSLGVDGLNSENPNSENLRAGNLSTELSLHPVQEAWIDNKVPQCGYCQSGQMMSAAALLAKNASPSDKEIDAAMQGNICRCGTYPRIRKAIKQAAATIQTNSEKVS